MMLRGGTAPFQIETGRWKGISQEERLCRECERNEEREDYNHWMLRCPRWELERWQSSAITGLVCEDRDIAQLIYIPIVDCKIELISLTVSVDYICLWCSFVYLTVPHRVCTLVLFMHIMDIE